PPPRTRGFLALAGAWAALAAAPARAQFIPTSGSAEYTDPANWTGAAINGQFTRMLTGNLTATFSADRVQTAPESGLLFNYGGGGVLTLQSADATPRLLTLNGDIVTGTSTTGNVVVIGSAANPLNLELGTASRTFTVGTGDTLTVSSAISSAGGT